MRNVLGGILDAATAFCLGGSALYFLWALKDWVAYNDKAGLPSLYGLDITFSVILPTVLIWGSYRSAYSLYTRFRGTN